MKIRPGDDAAVSAIRSTSALLIPHASEARREQEGPGGKAARTWRSTLDTTPYATGVKRQHQVEHMEHLVMPTIRSEVEQRLTGGENFPFSVKAARCAGREPGLRAALGRRPRPGKQQRTTPIRIDGGTHPSPSSSAPPVLRCWNAVGC